MNRLRDFDWTKRVHLIKRKKEEKKKEESGIREKSFDFRNDTLTQVQCIDICFRYLCHCTCICFRYLWYNGMFKQILSSGWTNCAFHFFSNFKFLTDTFCYYTIDLWKQWIISQCFFLIDGSWVDSSKKDIFFKV